MNEKQQIGWAQPWLVACEPPAGSPGTETAPYLYRGKHAALGVIVPNEPNLPRPGRKRPWLPRLQALPTLGSSAPNKANSPPAGRKGPEPAGLSMPERPDRNVRNKANSTFSCVDGKCLVNKEL
jgi:hypothetical protein